MFQMVLDVEPTNHAPGTSRGEADAPLVVGDGGEKFGHERERGIESVRFFGQGNKKANLDRKGS
jgi:hypothetical protein